jgi:PAS domain S-box-containing protein
MTMDRTLTDRISPRVIVVSSLLLGLVFWVLDSLVDSLVFYEGSLYDQLFRPGGVELWVRSFVLALFGVFGVFASVIVKRLRNAKAVLDVSHRVLKESEERFRKVFDEGPLGMAMFAGTKFLRANQVLCDMVGYTEDELRGMSFLDITHPERVEEDQEAVRRMLAGEIPVIRTEKRYVRRNGEVFWGAVTATAVRNDAGAYLYTLAMLEDIDQRRTAEEKLAHSEEFLRSVIETEPECVKLLDRDGVLLSMNPAGLEMLEAEGPEMVVGKKVIDVVDPADREAFLSLLEKVCDGSRGALEFRILGLKGGRRWVETHAVPFRDEKSGQTHMLAVTRDVTARKRAERELRESETRYRNLFSSIRDVIIVADPQRNIITANQPALREVFGYELEEVVGRNSQVLYADGEGYRVAGRRIFDRKEAVGGELFEIDFRRKSGEVFRGELYALKLLDEEGNPVGNFGVIRDVTERRRLEEQLVHAQKMEALGTLTGGIAHEFNNIMTAIIGFAEYLKDEMDEGDPSRQYATVIHAAAERAAKLTDGLLAYSRKKVPRMEAVDVSEVLDTVEGFLAKIVGENIALETKISASGLTVTADKAQMEQVLLNLATNAMDAMPQGGVLTIRADGLEVSQEDAVSAGSIRPGAYAVISVSDTGGGIHEDVRSRIFEPFFTTKDVGKGTGLGLSVVYGIIEQHHGYIFMDTRPGRGTTFSVYLPLGGETGRAGDGAEQGAAPVEPGEQSGTVLVAEDEEAVRTLLTKALENEGFTVIETADGQEALEEFERRRDEITLLVTDVAMPKKDGKALYEEIRKARPDMKVLFISGYLEDSRLAEISDAGHPFVRKPFSPKQLLGRVKELLA